MEMIIGIVKWITVNIGAIAGAVLMILGGFSIIAKLTPTKVDDQIIQKIIDFIHKLGLTKK